MTFEALTSFIPRLTVEERKRLIALLVDSLTDPLPATARSLLELEGLGAEIWEGLDASDYVNRLRDEWDKPRENC